MLNRLFFHSHIVFLVIIGYLIILTLGLVPRPLDVNQKSSLCHLREKLTYENDYENCFILKDALKRFDSIIEIRQYPLNSETTNPVCTIGTIQLVIENGCDETKQLSWPSETMNESYSILIANGTIKIVSVEIWGLLHGLETMAQLVYSQADQMNCVYETEIRDSPQFPHRGFLIDTSRHYLSLREIKKFLDAMAMVKMNILHWHIVDDHSFPYESYTFPLLSNKGAFDSEKFIYTQNDVRDVIEFARRRGIRVLPEFDTPGHTYSWGKGYPTLLTTCYKHGQPTNDLGPVNPANMNTYNFMNKFFEEVINVFPENWIHLGGDEVPFDCWQSNPEIQQFMKKMKFDDDFKRLEGYYIEQLVEIINRLSSNQRKLTSIVWQEIFENGFRSNYSTIIHVWKPVNWRYVVNTTTAAGYKVLFSSCWYLNLINYGNDWTYFYNCDPTKFGGGAEQIKLVIGGIAAMWGEYVDDTNLISRSWPRGTAVAERLWSQGKFDRLEFSPRLDEIRCRMLRRGLQAEPCNGPGYCPV